VKIIIRGYITLDTDKTNFILANCREELCFSYENDFKLSFHNTSYIDCNNHEIFHTAIDLLDRIQKIDGKDEILRLDRIVSTLY